MCLNPINMKMKSPVFTPLSKTKSRLFSSLSQRKMRRRHGLFTAEGLKSVEDLCVSRATFRLVAIIVSSPETLYDTDSRYRSFIDNLVHSHPGFSDYFKVSFAEMRSLSSLSTPGDIMAVFEIPEEESELSDLENGLYLMLDGIQDPGNLGTIIRTAHWFGIKRIFASRDTADIYNPKTVQSTMGSLSAVKVIYTDLPALADSNPDLPVIGLLLEGNDIFRTPLPSAGFIAMGNEGNGLSESMRKRVRLPLTIPPRDLSDHAESLNVAVATAITLAQFVE